MDTLNADVVERAPNGGNKPFGVVAFGDVVGEEEVKAANVVVVVVVVDVGENLVAVVA